jgi:ribosomal protein L20A (L18A)
MKRRYHMHSRDWKWIIEAPYNDFGLRWMVRYRSINPQFKFQRIKDVLQAYPEQVETYKRTETT